MKILLLLLLLIPYAIQGISQILPGTNSTATHFSDRYRNVGMQNNAGLFLKNYLEFTRMTTPGISWDNSCKVIRKGKSYIKIQIARRVRDTTYQFKFRNVKYDWEDDRVIVFTKSDIKDLGKDIGAFLATGPDQFLSSKKYLLRNEKDASFIGIGIYIEDGYCLLSQKEAKKLIKVIDNL